MTIFCEGHLADVEWWETEADGGGNYICQRCFEILPDGLDRGPEARAAAAVELAATGHAYAEPQPPAE